MRISEKTAIVGVSDSPSSYYHFEDLNTAVVRLFRDIRERDPEKVTVLDLGCGRGRLGAEIERLGFVVTGIDGNAVACSSARTRITEVLEFDLLQHEQIAAALLERKFDCLLAADVLEHTPDPTSSLRFYARFLKSDGFLVVSLPNVAVWDNRLRLLLGRFDYVDSGVLDRTHLRFFTFRTARQLILNTGFRPLRTTWESGIARAFFSIFKHYFLADSREPSAIIDSSSYRRYSRYVLPVEHLLCSVAPKLLAFRIVILARPH